MPKLRVIIKPPPEPQGDAEQQTEALRDYLLQMSEELAYVLTHLEADNINDSTFERIQSMIPRPYTGLPVMDGDASSGQSEQWSRGDHRHGHDSSKADVTALEAEAAAREAHEADTDNPHEVTKAQVGLGNVANERQYSEQNPPPIPTPAEVGAIPATEKGSAGGVAELDSNGMVPSAQLPSYVDDVLEYASISAFPVAGESGKIYVALDTNKTYRWGGSAYFEISESLALGETASTAYRGDRGKTAYDHSQLASGNPHNVSASDVGLGNVANERQYSAQNPPPLPTPADIGAATAQDLSDHVDDTNNPHGVTAAQVGARPDTWMPTAADVGARADTWMPTAADVGARPDTWTPSAADVGARPDTWVPDAEDVPYDNTGSGLMATDVQAAIDELAQGGGGGGTAASAVSYDNTGSGLVATNVQDAIDEVQGEIGNLPSPPDPSDANPQDLGTAAAGSSADYSRADHVHNKPTYTKADIGLGNVDNVQQYSASNPPPYPVTSVNGNTGAVTVSVPSAYTSDPAMDGTASPGSSGAWAKGDHVHPSDTSRVPVYGMGKNLLDNPDFANPVNQRGKSSYSTAAAYCIDRWALQSGSISLTSSGVKINASSRIAQSVENGRADLSGKTITFTALVTALTGQARLRIAAGTSPKSNAISLVNSSWIAEPGLIRLTYTLPAISSGTNYNYNFILDVDANSEATFSFAKLELGSQQTLCHNEGTDANPVWVLNDVPDYEYELYRCMTSTADSTDTFANKSLATEQQLAYVESGTTASRAYAVGEYFCWNGLLYRAKTAISSGGTFTPGTNCDQVTNGGFNELLTRATVVTGTTGATSETITVPAGRFMIVLASRGDTSYAFAIAFRYNNWQLSGTNTAGVTIDPSTGQLTFLSYTVYKIIY